MSQKWFIWILLLIVIMPLSFALDDHVTPQEKVSITAADLCSSLLEDYDLIGMEIPSFIPFTQNTFDVFVNGTPTAHIEIKDKKITNFDCTVVENPDYNVFISSNSIIQDIMDSENPILAYKKFKKNDDIKFQGNSFGKKIKVGFLNSLLGILNLFK